MFYCFVWFGTKFNETDRCLDGDDIMIANIQSEDAYFITYMNAKRIYLEVSIYVGTSL